MHSVRGIGCAVVFVDEPVTAEHILGERGMPVTGCSLHPTGKIPRVGALPCAGKQADICRISLGPGEMLDHPDDLDRPTIRLAGR